MTPPTGEPVAAPPATGPAFALHVSVDPAAGPMATSLLADVARRVLAVVEESGPLTRSRSLLSVMPTGRLSQAVARAGEALDAAASPDAEHGRPGPTTVRAGIGWGVPTQPARSDVGPATAAGPVAAAPAAPPVTPRWSGSIVPTPSTGAAEDAAAAGRPARPAATLVVDAGAREVTRRGVVVPLTYKELGLLEHLLRNPHRAVPRDELLREVWRKDVTARTTRTVDVHVRRLREKLGGCLRIVTVRGVGYRWDPTPEVVLVGSGDAG